jgi:phage terminase large subunit-like protein
MEFAALGKVFRERLFMAANRVGKTELGAYETTLHLTGDYPDWWPGRRFDGPVDGWAAGKTNKTTMDIIQEKLLGRPGERGTGMIPGDRIVGIVNKAGLAGAADTITVRHKSGRKSVLGLKAYEQGRGAFEGTAKHFVWNDEEPPLDVYTESLYRTATTGGLMYTTFTPLEGMSEVVMSFLEPDDKAAALKVKRVVMASWDDVPHLDAEAKAQLLAGTPPHQRDARTRGIPSLGSGAIYPVPESEILVEPRSIPADWPRCFALDVGWKRTAAVWIARDPSTGILYLYHEHYRGQVEPVIHAEGLKAPGKWIPGVADPASLGANQIDGRSLMQIYCDLGLDLQPADNAVESGIFDVWTLLSTGRLKVFESCKNWISEFRRYHRDEKGKIVKTDDHAMDATRYAVRSGIARMTTEPKLQADDEYGGDYHGRDGWMG